jgi:4-amino-4-deoxy-L-arabinose transferase-like glycosyltransferase
LGSGIPFAVGVDEPEIMLRVLAMLKTGDFNPHFFDYPGLIFYVEVPVAIGRFLVGAILGQWDSLDTADPAAFYFWARALTALFGIATVFLTYRVGIRWGTRQGLLAAGLLAVLPLHVRESHFVLADVPATFFAMLSLLVSLVAHERGSAKMFMWAGVTAGLTIAAKYNAGFVTLFPFVTAWMTPHASPSRMMCALIALAATCAGFLIGAPYSLIDLPGFLNGFAHLAAAYPPGDTAAGAIIYLKHLRGALGWPALLLLGPGLALGIARAIRGPIQVPSILLTGFPVIYFLTIASRSLIFGRYLLPLLPFVCLLVAVGLISIVGLLYRLELSRMAQRVLTAGLTLAAVLPPARVSVGFDRAISQRSTNQIAYEWILQNVPAKSRVVIEKYDLRLPESKYSVTHVKDLTNRRYEDYVHDGVQYLIASSQVFGAVLDSPQVEPDRYARYRALFQRSQEVFAVTSKPGRPGPELRVFLLRADEGRR